MAIELNKYKDNKKHEATISIKQNNYFNKQ